MNKNNNIKTKKLENILSNRFSRYAKYIIQERALPDLRDGLKPVQRRILYAMNNLHLTSEAAYKKSARIVGEVIGKYHPHGDSSIYEALVRLSQPWKQKYPLIKMQGNNGSIDGDSAAAMRYTEVKLTPLSNYLLSDLEKNVTKFVNNFDDSEVEPTVLFSQIPQLLLNGATGIAVGMATNIPPHNLHEMIDSLIYYIQNPYSNLKDILKILKGPDFPTGGIIFNKSQIEKIYKNGSGKIFIRAKHHFKKNSIIITEIPYDVKKIDLVKQIEKIRINNEGLKIKSVIDTSDRNGLKIIIKLNNNANIKSIIDFLILNSSFQISYNANLIGIINNRPEQFTILNYLSYYFDYYQNSILNLMNYKLNKLKSKQTILKGLIIALKHLEEVIKIIRESKNKSIANLTLQNHFKLNLKQADAVLQLQLYRLTSTDIKNTKKDLIKINNKIKYYKNIINNESVLNNFIVDNLIKIKSLFKNPRKSIITNESEYVELNKENIIENVKVKGFVTKLGYLYLYNENYFNNLPNQQIQLKNNDYIFYEFNSNSLNSLFLFIDNGYVTKINLFNLKLQKIRQEGVHLNSLCKVKGSIQVTACFLENNPNIKNKTIFISTKKSFAKRIKLEEVSTIKSQKQFIKLNNEDKVCKVNFIFEELFCCFITCEGLSAKYSIADFPIQSLTSKGVKAMKLNESDEIIYSGCFYRELKILLINNHLQTKIINLKNLKSFLRPVKGVKIFTKRKSKTLEKELITNVFNVNQNLYHINETGYEKYNLLETKTSNFVQKFSLDILNTKKIYQTQKLIQNTDPSLVANKKDNNNLQKSNDENEVLQLNFNNLFEN